MWGDVGVLQALQLHEHAVLVVCQDFSEHGIAPRGITTSQEFSSRRRDEVQEKARAVSAQAALIPGDTLLEELIAPAR